MIVVRVELWPHGDSRRLKPLAQLTISNTERTAPDDPTRLVYLARLGDQTTLVAHRRDDGILVLVAMALAALVPLDHPPVHPGGGPGGPIEPVGRQARPSVGLRPQELDHC